MESAAAADAALGAEGAAAADVVRKPGEFGIDGLSMLKPSKMLGNFL